MKRLLFGFIFLFCLSSFVMAFQVFFKDVLPAHPAYPAIKKLLAEGIINVSSPRKFNGSKPLTMYQLAIVFDKILEKTARINEIQTQEISSFFIDVPRGHYAYKAVADLVKLGVFSAAAADRFDGNTTVNENTFYSYAAVFIAALGNNQVSSGNALAQKTPAECIKILTDEGLLGEEDYIVGGQIVNRYQMAMFVAKMADFLVKAAPQSEPVSNEETAASYIDIPADNYAKSAVEELVAQKIFIPGENSKFHGEQPVNRYLLVDCLSKVIEKILVGNDETLEMANLSLAYKDVPVGSFAYDSVQKMIAQEILPAGNQTELFYGDRNISRYQMVFFAFSSLEQALSDVMKFKEAEASAAYHDVPSSHFTYSTIQKLIWLGVLEGGQGGQFHGEEYVNRYELAFFTVNLIKAVYVKMAELKITPHGEAEQYGIKSFLQTQLLASQVVEGIGMGKNLNNLTANQFLRLSLAKDLSEKFSAFASLSTNYYFGSPGVLSTPYLDNAQLMLRSDPYNFQAGRITYYQGYTPFGNSLFLDTTSDMILTGYDSSLLSCKTSVGKFSNTGNLSADSNFGFVSLSPQLTDYANWLEMTLGGSLVTNLASPLGGSLPTRLVQSYGGLKVNLWNILELTGDLGSVNYSNPGVLPIIKTGSDESFSACQYALNYYSMDFGLSMTVGYQKIGSYYYLGNLANPTLFLGGERGTESWQVKGKIYTSSTQDVGGAIAYVGRAGNYWKTVVNVTYNDQLFDYARLNVALTKSMGNAAQQNEYTTVSSALSVSF